MATGRRFKVTNGLDNNLNTITGIDASNSTLSLAGDLTTAGAFTTVGGHAITLTSTGTTNVTLPTSGTLISSADSGTVTSTMIANGTITNDDISASAGIAVSKLSASTISGVTLGNNLNALTIGTGLSGTSYNGSSAVTIAVNSTLDANARVAVEKNGSLVGTRRAINFIEGTGVTLTIADDSVNEEIDVTINATGSLSGSGTANQVAYWSGTSALTGEAGFTYDPSTDTLTVANLTVSGTTTNINTTNLVVEDKNVVLGDVTTPSDTTADGGGITLKGATDKTFNWVDATDSWTSSEHMNLLTGKSYRINGTEVLSNNTLGSGVVNSSLTSVGTITTGTWNATTIATTRGGTGLTSFTSGGALYATSTSALTTGTLPVASGGTGITSFGTGVATALGQNVTGSGGIVLATSPTLATPNIGVATATSVALANALVGSATVTTTSITQTALNLAPSATYRSLKVLVSASNSTTTRFATSELLLVHDGTTVYLTEYGVVGNNAQLPWTSLDADISGGNIRLLVTSTATSSTVYKVQFSAVAI